MAEKQVGNRLQPTRKERGWTAAELSARTKGEVPMSTIQKIERRVYAPNVETALVLAETLDTTVESLFFLEPSQLRLNEDGGQ